MFISKKKYTELLQRIEQLEKKTTVNTYDFGEVDLKTLCRKLPAFVDKRIAADKRKLSAAEKDKTPKY